MESDDLLCLRNARSEKDGMGSLVVLLLAERARLEGARSTRAIEDQPGCPVKAGKRAWRDRSVTLLNAALETTPAALAEYR
jgi:hypothetical protein